MKKIDKIILYLFYVYVFMLPFENFVDELFGIKSPYRPFRILCLFIGILILVSRKFRSIRFYPNDLKLLGVYVFGLIPSLVAYLNNRLNEEYFWSTSLQYFIVLWILLLIKNVSFEMKHIQRTLFVYSLGILLNGIYMIFQFFYKDIGRQSGLMDNPDFAAFACNIGFVFFFYYFVRSQRSFFGYIRILSGIASMVLILALFIAGSRSAIISMGIIILFLLYYRISFAKKLGHSMILISILFLVWFSSNSSNILNVFPAWSRFATLEGKEDPRITLWMRGFEAFKETNYIGLGIEQFKNPVNYTKYIKQSDNLTVINQKGLVVHNDFLTVLFEYGIIAFLLFLSFYLTLYKKVLNNTANIKEPVMYYGLFINMVWLSIFASSFQSHSMWFIYIILGFVAYLKPQQLFSN